MAEGSEGEDKTEEASAHKLDEARKKGNVAKSADLPQALSLIGVIAVLAMYGPTLCMQLGSDLVPFLAHPQQLLGSLEGDGGMGIARSLFLIIAPALAILMGGALVLGVIGNVMQTGFLITPSKLAPDFSRLNPMSGLGRIFGMDALVQFAKTFVKLLVTGVIAFQMLKPHAAEISQLAAMSPALILPYSLKILLSLAMAMCLFLLVGAGIDYMWQRFRFAQKMRMSKQEQKEEYKQQEGDPHIKAKLRQIRMEKSRRRMMSNVKKAAVVITNPTHYAVALSYEMGNEGAPVCVAKGMDAIALSIREEAGKHDIPIVEDPPLARALYASVEIDEEITPEHYRAVSSVISFVMTRKRRGF